jgi:hypothetical protein
MAQAESLLQTLVAEGWFECSKKKYYSLAPRALMELRGWLIETYNDEQDQEQDEENDDEETARQRVKFCAACRQIVTLGQRCADLDCLGRLHDGCTGTMFRSLGNREICPVCKKSWENHGLVGEKAEGARRTSMGGAAVASSSRAAYVNGDAEEAEEEDYDEDDDNEQG